MRCELLCFKEVTVWSLSLTNLIAYKHISTLQHHVISPKHNIHNVKGTVQNYSTYRESRIAPIFKGIDTNPDMIQILKLQDKDFKSATIIMPTLLLDDS